MTKFTAKVSRNGGLTIPMAIRERLGIMPGATVNFTVEDDGTVRMAFSRHPTVASLAGAASTLPEPTTWAAMRAIAREDRTRS